MKENTTHKTSYKQDFRKITSVQAKKGFTLAEIIIVISILGIITAITIGNLINNTKKNYVEVRLKKAFAVLDNAFRVL